MTNTLACVLMALVALAASVVDGEGCHKSCLPYMNVL